MFSVETRYELEHVFASNFKSPIFPILADLYYKNKEYKRAWKVCEIGLKNDPNNLIGLFIFSKLHLIKNNMIEAEKILKKIIYLDSCNISALLTLIEVTKGLNRSQNTIKNLIGLAYKKTPNNKRIKKLYLNYFNDNNNKKTKKNYQKNNNILTNEELLVSPDMATKTMYKLLLRQKKHQLALQVLEAMKKKNKDKKFISIEMKKLKKLDNR